MKNDEVLYTMDGQFIKAVNAIQDAYQQKGLPLMSFYEISDLIYKNNRSIVKHVIEKKSHVPHLAAMRFAKLFNIEPNFFYDADQKISCHIPQGGEEYIVSKISFPLLEQYLEKKIAHLERSFNVSDDFILKFKNHWKQFARAVVLVSKGIPLSKVVELLDVYFDSLVHLMNHLQPISRVDVPSVENTKTQDKYDVYKEQIASLQEIIKAKELEISGLKKYTSSLEKLVL